MTYIGLPFGFDRQGWLDLFCEATPEYAAQPYQQLAAVYRGAGRDGDVRAILIAQRQAQLDRGALTGRGERAWARVTGGLLGYGYQPWRALLGLAGVLIASVVLAVVVGAHGALDRTSDPTHPATAVAPRTVIERVGVGLDLGTPLLTTHGRDRCPTTTSATSTALIISAWVLQTMAWGLAALFIAGFTGIVRKS